MAEGLLRHMLAVRSVRWVHVRSAGTHAMDGRPAEPHAITAAHELGADITAHRARSLDRDLVDQADLILVMEQEHADLIARVLPPARQAEVLHLLAPYSPAHDRSEVDDPYGQPLDAYRTCIHFIQQCLTGVLYRLARIEPPS